MKKLIILITLTVYFINIIIPQGVTAENIINSEVFSADSKTLCTSLPVSSGVIFESNLKNGIKPDLIIIEDLHSNAYVQKNIFNIIDYFSREIGIGYIFTEGAPEGEINLDSLHSLTPEKVKNQVLDNMLNKGLLGAAEYYGAVNRDAKLYGLESWSVYMGNIERYQNINKKETSLLHIISSAEMNLNIDKLKNYNKDMFLYEDVFYGNSRKDKKHFEKINYLTAKYGIKTDSYKNIKAFASLSADKNKEYTVGNETRYFSGLLRNKISFYEYKKLFNEQKNKNSEERLIILYEKSKFFLTCEENKKYIYIQELKKKYELINVFDLKGYIEETNTVKQILFDKISKGKEARNTGMMSLFLALLKDYVKLNIMFEDLEYIQNNKEKFKRILSGSSLQDKKNIADIIDNKEIEEYYDTNLKRNKIFVDIIKKKRSGTKTDVAVVGGFHHGITKMLEDEGISYIVIMPKSDKTDLHNYKTTILDITVSSDALSDGLLVMGLSKYKQREFLTIWIQELRNSGFKDYEIIEILNKWANSYKNFFGANEESVRQIQGKEETESEFVNDEQENIKEENNISETAKADSSNTQTEEIDLSEVVKESKKITVKKLLISAKVAVKSYLAKFKKPFVYRYEKSRENAVDEKTVKKMESNIRYFPFIQLMLGFELASSFSTIFMQSSGYELNLIAVIFSFLAPASFVFSGFFGFLGDRIPKRTMLILSLLLHTLGSVSFTVIQFSPVLFIASQILPVIGIAGLDISLSPFLYKSLDRLKKKESFKEIYGLNLGLFWITMSLSSLIGGTLAFFVGQHIVVIIAAMLDVAVFVGSLFFTHKESDGKVEKEEVKEETGGKKNRISQIFSPLRALFTDRKTFMSVIINMVVNNIFFVSLAFFLQPLFISSGLSAIFLAPIYFAANVLQSMASHFISRFGIIAEKKLYRTLFLSSALVMTALFAVTAHPVFLFAVYVSMNFWQGTASLTEVSSVYEILDDNMRSKWLAFKSMAGTVVASFTQIAISGLLSLGITGDMIITVAISVAVFASVVIPKIFAERHKKHKEVFEAINIDTRYINAILASA
ncbi:MAG: MFS transporter [Endomicrobiaceae bacterium]|nr:MFS transporter [Endomicrobiaceae bacterium]MDD3922285.1 MFS transporter [Endomicrobiaceae bacterium]